MLDSVSKTACYDRRLAVTVLMSHRTLTILGSTGSIGTNTLDVVRQNPERFHVFALAAGRNIELLAQQIQEFKPEVAVVEDAADVDRLRALLPETGIPELLSGPEALVQDRRGPRNRHRNVVDCGSCGARSHLRGGLRGQAGRARQ